MNLKESFRYQNKLQLFMETAEHILQNESNITKVENTYLRHKLSSEAEDETIIDDIKTPTLIQFNYSSAAYLQAG